MLLSSDSIGLAQKACDPPVQLGELRDPEAMDMISGTDRLDPSKAPMLDPALQPYRAIEPVLPWRRSRKARARLEDDARLLRVHGHRTAAPHEVAKAIKELPDD
jgi:hypothetical protein